MFIKGKKMLHFNPNKSALEESAFFTINKDFISALPYKLLTTIFFDYLDEKSRWECTFLNKRMKDFISKRQLADLKILCMERLSPNSQLMEFYKKYCVFFHQKAISSFFFDKGSKLTDLKNQINNTLKEHEISNDSLKNTLINEIWSDFINYIDPNSSLPPLPKVDEIGENFFVSNPNVEIDILLTAGVDPNIVGHQALRVIIMRDWCTVETFQKLINKNFKVTLDVITHAIQVTRYQELLPSLFQLIEVNVIALRTLIETAPPSYESYIETFMEKIPSTTPYMLRRALEANYSEKFIFKLVNKCSKGVTPYHIRLALERNYSEKLIFVLLDMCTKSLNEYHVRVAIEYYYSQHLIQKLVAKMSGELKNYHIWRALDTQIYSEELIEILMHKIKNEQVLLKALESVIERSSYNNIVKKFFPEARGTFIPTILEDAADHGYTEDVFLKILFRSDQTKSIKNLDLSVLKAGYSEKTIRYLIEHGMKLNGLSLPEILKCHYSESILHKILDNRTETIKLQEIRIAQKMHYSDGIIQKMQLKCPDKDNCIIL